jgi:hypothetical protein
MTLQFQPPPTYADPVIVDESTRKGQFNPIWLKWFLDITQYINRNGGGAIQQHNSLGGLQGGNPGNSEYFHLSNATYTFLTSIPAATNGGVAYGNGSTINFTAAGTTGQVLTSNGTSPPTWTTLSYQSISAPVTYTANFSVAATDLWIIVSNSASTTATLPTASSYTGRVLHFQNYQAQTLVSASSNVVPLAGGSAGTAILNAMAGDTCTLVSNGTNWIMTQYTPNNVLLI